MERVLVVSPDAWVGSGLAALSRERFVADATTYEDALRACREIHPTKVVVTAAGDMGRASLVVHRVHGLGKERPTIILVGLPAQEDVMKQHSTLRKRADVYVVEGKADLTEVVERAERAPPLRETLNPGDVTFLATILLAAIAAPLLEWRGHVAGARASVAVAAVLGIASDALRRREGRPGSNLFRVGLLAVLIAMVFMTIRRL